jgi:hypothetical protein
MPARRHWRPSFRIVRAVRALTDERARKVYAVAATNTNVIRHIPCYCGCREQGHQHTAHCVVKRQAADGRMIEWNEHGGMCPLGPDIVGDAVPWHQHGSPLHQIRVDIDREFSLFGPPTPTPPVPAR